MDRNGVSPSLHVGAMFAALWQSVIAALCLVIAPGAVIGADERNLEQETLLTRNQNQTPQAALNRSANLIYNVQIMNGSSMSKWIMKRKLQQKTELQWKRWMREIVPIKSNLSNV